MVILFSVVSVLNFIRIQNISKIIINYSKYELFLRYKRFCGTRVKKI